MDTPTLCKAVGCSEQGIRDLIRRGHLGLEKGRQGRARDWPRDEALTIGYFCALSAAGAPLQAAGQIASFLAKTGDEFEIWAFNREEPWMMGGHPAGQPLDPSVSLTNLHTALATDSANWSEFVTPDHPPIAIAIINLGEIRRRIDDALKED